MSADKSQRDTIPADLQPYYDPPQTGTRTWARWLTRILAIIIVAILLVLAVRWIWDQTHEDTDDKKTGTDSSQTTKTQSFGSGSSEGTKSDDSSASNTPTTTNAAPSTPSSPSGSSSTTAPAAGSTSAATQSVGQSTALVNTGPGETIAVFLAATLGFAVLYQLRARKQVQ